MLYLYQSNHLEQLAEAFSQLTEQSSLSDAFAKEIVWVQSRGMGRFLELYLAKEQGICANVDFTLPATFTWQLIKTALPETTDKNIYTKDILRWRILMLLKNEVFQHHSVFQHYLSLGEMAAFEFAGKMADLFDQYLVYRPQWINQWEQGKLVGLGEDEQWQADLWRALVSDNNSSHRVRLWQQLLQQLGSVSLPERIHVFGLSSLAPAYIDLLGKLSEHTDIHLFTLNPCQEYWGDLIEAATILQQPPEYQHLSLSGHPLLASLGKQGRDFFDLLNDLPIASHADCFVENQQVSLLAQLQNDLLNLRLPTPIADPENQIKDKSIQIHSAHSPLRELQILKDQLLAILETNPGLSTSDIAVLTPDIEVYAPLIGCVFHQAFDTVILPFSITDTSFGQNYPLLSAFEQLLLLFQSRFEVDAILNLLDIPPLAQRFELTRQDITVIRHFVQQMNICWGLDEQMRAQYGGDSDAFTWQKGLKRLALGFMFSNAQLQERTPLWQKIAASSNSFIHADILAKLMQFLTLVQQTQAAWQTPCEASQWQNRLQRLLEDFFVMDSGQTIAQTQLDQLLSRLGEETKQAGFDDVLSYEVVYHYLLQGLRQKNDRNFLKGGITFCSMVPMRSLPFKVLCLIGLNDNDYPRDEKSVHFDLIGRHPQKGDRSRRNDDRYLFLEAILSAREQLYLSFVGRNIYTDEVLPPSTLVNELLDTLAQMTGLHMEELASRLVCQHPLQPYSKKYFLPDSPLFSFQQHFANALNKPRQSKQVFIDQSFEVQIALQKIEIHLEDFIRFWCHPVRDWLSCHLDWQAQFFEQMPEQNEPFYLNRQQEKSLLKQLMQDKIEHRTFEQNMDVFQAQDRFPAGMLGELYQTLEIDKVKNLYKPQVFNSQPLPLTEFALSIGQYTIWGALDDLFVEGRAVYAPFLPNAAEYIRFLLKHLCLCAGTPPGVLDCQSVYFNTEKTLTLVKLDQDEAKTQLAKWLDYYHLGQSKILPFFPRTHLAMVQNYLKTEDKQKALSEAYKVYLGNSFSRGEGSYEVNALVFDGQDPLANPLFWQIAEDLLLPLMRLAYES